MSTDDYVCTLSEEDLAVARDELHEDPKERMGAVETLRTWINDQKWLKCPTDTNFLLKVLRHRKFSQLAARESVEKYWTIRSQYPKWFGDVDTTSKDIQELLDLGIFLILPKRERHGRRVMMCKQGMIDTGLIENTWGMDIVLKVELCCLDVIAREEQTQVRGMVAFLDQSDISSSTMTSVYNPSNMSKFVKCIQNAYPMRIKQVHLYNQPPVMEALLTTIKPFMKEKLRNRIVIHGHSLVKVYDDLGMECLPREYLPDDYNGPHGGTISEIIDYTKKEFQNPAVRDYVQMVSSKQYGVDLTLKRNQGDVPAESFRKLNLD